MIYSSRVEATLEQKAECYQSERALMNSQWSPILWNRLLTCAITQKVKRLNGNALYEACCARITDSLCGQ
jgi:hypothetical protein